MTIAELKLFLANIKGCSICSITYFISPSCKNKAAAQRIKKLSTKTVMLGAKYENAVGNQRIREGNWDVFSSEDYWGGMGQWLQPHVIYHTQKQTEYLVYYPIHRDSITGFVEPQKDIYYLDGVEVPYGIVAQFLKPQNPVPKQDTDKHVPWRVIELKNIKSLTIKNNKIIME